MKTLLSIALTFTFGVTPFVARAQATISNDRSDARVSGKVRLLEKRSGKVDQDASGAVVWLVPLVRTEGAQSGENKKTYRMVQRNKQFDPHLLIVPVGSIVVFPNLDPWFHNVFSLYRGKRFDLGLYEAGSEKAVTFDRPGASYIFCNIHPEMMAVVLAVESSYYAISDRNGAWSIRGVPPGGYRLHVWYENATPSALQTLDRDVTVGQDGAALAAVSVPVTPHAWLHHLNLYGRPYDSQQLTPMY
jgi:plastocyanin